LLVDPEGLIEAGDVVISFNFRTDRPRQITQALTQTPFPEWEMKPLDLYFITMTRYDETYKEVKVVFDKDHLENTLGETVSNAGKTQLRIAETEKYPHVTFFFSGGREEPYPGEQRILVKSPSVPTYDLAPEMSSSELSTRLIAYIDEYTPDFFCMNYASPDMVGHTGVYSAIVKAVESVDSELNRIVKHLTQRGYELIVLADHGNAEKAINSDGSPNTSHTLNPVPCIYIGHRNLSLKNGILADVAPTLLELLGINKPDPMTGISLIC
jgi:2,3-bisphosphoglycerate-independent phosphoglycerate mutase